MHDPITKTRFCTVCAKINAIRAAHGNPGTHCPTCCRPVADAHFRTDARGKAIEGCVDAYHATAYKVGERARWYSRPEAHALRKAELAHIQAL